jgi:hypothetical protein
VGAAWAKVVTSDPSPRHADGEQPSVDAVVVRRAGEPEDSRCLSTLGRQHYDNLQVVTASDRASGVEAGASAWLVFLEDEDELEPEFLETMVRAQQASGADVVTCGLHSTGRRGQRFFIGEPGGLGILENGYGTVALIRRSLLSHELLEAVAGEADPDWRLLARLSLSGAAIVSVPLPLATRSRAPGRLERNSVDAALVLREFESVVPRPLDSIARLAAGLAADAQTPRVADRQPIVQRVRERLARSRG